MNDIRRTVLWVIFGFSMVLLWDRWQVHNGRQATFFPTPPAATGSPASTSGTAPARMRTQAPGRCRPLLLRPHRAKASTSPPT
jgi:YidC/Oxa1 family membrane protein insertase